MRRETGRRSNEADGRDWGDVSTSQGTPKLSANPQKLGERHGADSLSQPSGGTYLAYTLIMDSKTMKQ